MNNIIRVEHSKNYTVISNDAIRDKRLGLKARGLHHLLLSYPDNWKISIEHLAKEASDADGRTAIQNALKELEVFGYLTREQVRDIKGRITGWENVVRELPQAGFPIVDKTTSGKHHNRKNRKRENPNVDNPPTENPATENQYLINTDPYEVSKKEIPIPPTPQGEKEGVGENSASPEEDSGISTNSPILDQQNQPSDGSNNKADPGDKNSAGDRDNKPTRRPDGDKYFGAVREQNYQRSLAARIQRGNVIPISEYEIWESPTEFEEFEEYLLSKLTESSWCQDPASYVAKKLKDIATGKEAATELKQWRKDKQEVMVAKSQPTGQPQERTKEEQEAEAKFLAEMRSPDFHAHLRRPTPQHPQTQEMTNARPQQNASRSSLRSRLFPQLATSPEPERGGSGS